MTNIIGVLPASGNANRLGGIPKFCLPISDTQNLIEWHVEQMLEVCNEVRVSTKAEWVPIIKNMNMDIKLIVREPSTMSDAIKFIIGEYNDTVMIGMPDTYIAGTQKNIYKEMINTSGDLVLGTWECTEELKGRVGQISLYGNKVVSSKDKVNNCDYEYMWGTMLFRKNLIRYVDASLDHPGKQIQEWIDMSLAVRSVMPGGKYMDAGTFNGLKELYKNL